MVIRTILVGLWLAAWGLATPASAADPTTDAQPDAVTIFDPADRAALRRWPQIQTPNGSVEVAAVTDEAGRPAARFTWRIAQNQQDWLIIPHEYPTPIATAGYRHIEFDALLGENNRFTNFKIVTTTGQFEDALFNIAPTLIPCRWARIQLDLQQAGVTGDIRQIAFYQGSHWRGVEVNVPYTLDIGPIRLVPGGQERYVAPPVQVLARWSVFLEGEAVELRVIDRRDSRRAIHLSLGETARDVEAGAEGVVVSFGALPAGDHVLRVDGEPSRPIRVLPPAGHIVRFDWHAALHRDGEVVFPVGLYFLEEVASDAELAEAAYAGFNCFTRPTDHPGNALRVLDRVRSATDNRMFILGGPFDNGGQKEDLDYWRDVLGDPRVREHPGTFAWYLDDEPSMVHLDTLRQVDALIRGMDPYHPTMVMLNTPLTFEAYADFVDVPGGDIYPWPSRPPGEVGRFTRRLVQAGDGARPTVIVIQAFRDVGLRQPPPDVVRAMTYGAVAGGARGILFYAYRHQGGQASEDIWRVPRSDPALWSAMKSIASELRDLGPALALGVDVAGGAVSEHPDLQHRQFDHEGYRYLLLVNTGGQPVAVRAALTGAADEAAVESLLDGPGLTGNVLERTVSQWSVTLLRWRLDS